MLYGDTLGLAEAIARRNAQPVSEQTVIVEIDKPICRFCLVEKNLYVRVNSQAAAQGRFVIIKEKRHGKNVNVVWGVCCPCAEKLGMVDRPSDNDN